MVASERKKEGRRLGRFLDNYDTTFACRYSSKELGIGIGFPEFWCLDAFGVEDSN